MLRTYMWLCLVLWGLLRCHNAFLGGLGEKEDAQMAIWSKLGLSGPAAAAGAVIIVVVAGGAYLVTQNREMSAPKPQPVQVVTVPELLESVTRTEQGASSDADAAAEQPAPRSAAEVAEEIASIVRTPAVPTITAPAFDVVQVSPDGGGVIAGSAEPGEQVVFLLDGVEIARGKADASGKFGVLLDFPASDAPRALSMVTELADGTTVASEGTVLISPVQTAMAVPEPTPELPSEQVAEAEPETQAAPEPTAPEPAAPEPTAPEPAITEPAVTEQAETDPVAPEPTAPADAPAVVLADNTGITVLQPAPQPAAPQTQADAPVVANVVIDTITYDAEGEVALAGRGAAQGFVRVYLNDQPIKTIRIAENGAWEAPLPDVDAGVYSLRVDEVDEDGTVTSRVETPFQREAPEIATATPKAATAVTVQPGFTLWAIARDRFGTGDQYVRVYEANRDLIRNPDLIYPGQVFALPEG